MSELDDVLAALEASHGSDAALATVVAVRGSTYRREGARLVVPAGDGPTVGNISGGCLEGDVAANAREVLTTGRPVLLSFDLTADDEAVWGWGLGCNGAIDVFVEPAREAARFASAMRTAMATQRPLALATVVAGDPLGARMVVHGDGRRDGSLGDAGADQDVAAAAAEALRERRSTTVTRSSGWRVFVEVLVPPLRLVVCGAGHDAIPLVEFGARLGWRVEVVDDRRAMLVESRFPQASRLIHAQPGDAATAAGVDERSFVVVMSHNF
ncbi:MAG TPA: XdhC family protein, partial [Acidimicrobiales bacterium]